jgi:hypothetical protein
MERVKLVKGNDDDDDDLVSSIRKYCEALFPCVFIDVKTPWKLEEDHMAQFVGVDHVMYAHNQMHVVMAQRDHDALCHILSTLP